MYENIYGSTDKKKAVKCPVCKGLLGYKRKEENFEGHCDECLAVYTWEAGKESPKAVLDRTLRMACKCASCKDRDE